MPEKTKEFFSFVNYNRDGIIFNFKSKDKEKNEFIVNSKIKLNNKTEVGDKTVITDISIDQYIVKRLVNPFLNAQSDLFNVKMEIGDDEKTIGCIIPATALVDDIENEDFDEYVQAYKYYCIKYLLEEIEGKEKELKDSYSISDLTDINAIFIIIYKPLLEEKNFNIDYFLPNLALLGYYNYPKSSQSKIIDYVDSFRGNIIEFIESQFHSKRILKNIVLKYSKKILEESIIAKLLYTNLLIDSDNPLYRFLLIYQIIEYLNEITFTDSLNNLISKKDDYTKYKFIQKLNELNNIRCTINKLFNHSFDEKKEITKSIKDFLIQFDSEYEKESTGDCFYDIRNLLFHDYKSVIEKSKFDELIELVFQCEILIHRLVISYDSI